MFESVVLNLLISLLLGAAIGLERQSARKSDSGKEGDSGIRTFSLVGLLGCLSAIFYVNNLPLIFAAVTGGFVVILCAHFILTSIQAKDYGFTTEISFLLTFSIGACTGSNLLPTQVVVAISVVIIVILSVKRRSQKLLLEISRHEIESFISFAILALVILPFLSNTSYKLTDLPIIMALIENSGVDITQFSDLEILNPQRLWFIVVLITGIDIFGYVLSKFVGTKKGFTFASFVGGFVSSTLTTQSLAQNSKTAADENYLVGAAILANLAGFFQIFLLVGPLNIRWLIVMLPTLMIIIVTSAMLGFYFLRKKPEPVDSQNGGELSETSDKKIFSIIPALKFAVLLLFIKIVTNLCLILFGKTGFVLSSIIASFAGIDAILINLAGMAGNSITFSFALFTFILVNATNLLAKSFYCYLQGSRRFTLKFFVSVVIIITTSFVGFLFV